MAAGQWNIALSPDIPKATRDLLDYFGHVFIFDAPMHSVLSDASMIATSRWGGVVRTRLSPWEVGGANMITWLGDEDGKGPILETALTNTNAAFSAYFGGIVTACPAVTSGTAGAIGGTQTLSYQWITPRAALDNLCSIYNAEYRVNKDATVDYGAAGSSALFVQTPTAIAMRRSSGRDQNFVGISVTQLDVSIDAEEYIDRVLVQDGTSAWTASNSGQLLFRSIGADSDGTLKAWTLDVATPTIAANVVTMPISSRLRAGLSTWTGAGAIADVRMTWSTGAKPMLGICCDNGVNGIFCFADGTNLALVKMVGGVLTTVASVARALVNGTSYWMQIAGVGTTYTVAVYSDVSGKRGALLTSTSGTVASPTTGQITLNNGTWTIVPTGTCTFGGAFTNVCWLVGPTPYKDLNGNLVKMTKAFIQPNTTASAAADQATNLLLAGPALRQAVTLSTDEFDVGRDVAVGDWIYVYDVDGSLVDTLSPGAGVHYRGSIVYPLKLRVLANTWPVQRGMGVWYRDVNGAWTDITNYVLFEPAGATFEVGAPLRALVKT